MVNACKFIINIIDNVEKQTKFNVNEIVVKEFFLTVLCYWIKYISIRFYTYTINKTHTHHRTHTRLCTRVCTYIYIPESVRLCEIE